MNTLSPLAQQLIDKAPELKPRKQDHNAYSVAKFVHYVGQIIQSDGKLDEFGATPLEVINAAREASQTIFHAQDALKNEAEAGIGRLKDAHITYSQARLIPEKYGNSIHFISTLANATGSAFGQMEFNDESAKPVQDQIELLGSLVQQADRAATADGEDKANPIQFQKELDSLLKANADKFTTQGAEVILKELNAGGVTVESMAIFTEAPDLKKTSFIVDKKNGEEAKMKAFEEAFGQGDYSEIEASEMQTVCDLIDSAKDFYAENKAELGAAKAMEQAQGALGHALTGLDTNQKAFFRHLTRVHTETKAGGPNQLIENLGKILPNLAVPGLIGAALTHVFGFGFQWGAIGMMLMAWLGGEKETENSAVAEPSGKTPPPFRVVSKTESRPAA